MNAARHARQRVDQPARVPSAPEGEAGLLACLLQQPDLISAAVDAGIGPTAFDDLRHAGVWSAMVALGDSGQAVDLITLQARLKGQKWFETTGGVAWLAQLENAALSPANWAGYVALLKQAEARRQLLGLGRQMVDMASQGDVDAAGALAEIEATVGTIHAGLASAPVAQPWIDAGQSASDADVLIGPGRWITRGAGVLLIAYTGSGKSTWAATQSFSWAIGRESLGMRPNGPLRSLVFQAEDDAGDLGSMSGSNVTLLSPSAEQREMIRLNVLVITESAMTGTEFLRRRVAPALRQYRPDLLWLNPLGSYFGADLNDQREVAAFFRNTCNPLLAEYRCACFAVHHCPKPSKERREWTGGQLAYAGAGSADLANWAREVIMLRETSPGLFEMSLAKRWRKIGWTDAEGRPTATRLIAHDQAGGQVWRDATPDLLEQLGARPYSDAAFLALVPEAGIDRAELVRRVADTFSVTERTAGKFVADARRERRHNVNGHAERFAILEETTRPRREVYPDKPEGRAVVWLTQGKTAKEIAKEALRKP
ncbi:MAG: AAA family ATPase [Verrucomicrobiota bacterium]|jgi:hypothetical protein